MGKKGTSSQRGVSSPRVTQTAAAPRESYSTSAPIAVDPFLHEDTLDSVWIDAEAVMTRPRRAERDASSTGRRSGSFPVGPLVSQIEDLHTPSSQLLSQQARAEVSDSGEHAAEPLIATALFALDATVAAKPAHRSRRGSTGKNNTSAVATASPLVESFMSEQTGGALSSSPRSSRGRGSSSSVAAAARGSEGHTALWSPHDSTVRAMLSADPPTATRPVQLARGYAMPSPQTPLWSQLENDEDEDEEEGEGRANVFNDVSETFSHRRGQRGAATDALADRSIALVSGESADYTRHLHHLPHPDEDGVPSSLTQEALALEAELHGRYPQPLPRGRRQHDAGVLPRDRHRGLDAEEKEEEEEESVEWTVTRRDVSEESVHASKPHAMKRSRSSVALVEGSVGARSWGGAAAALDWSPSTIRGRDAASRSHTTTNAIPSSSQRRLQSWASEQREFFHFIDGRDILTVREEAHAGPRKVVKAAASRNASAARDKPQPQPQQQQSHTRRKSVSIATATGPTVPRTTPSSSSSVSFSAKRQPLLLASRLSGSHGVGERGSDRGSRGASQFAQFVTNVKKRGTAAAAAAPSPSSRPSPSAF